MENKIFDILQRHYPVVVINNVIFPKITEINFPVL